MTDYIFCEDFSHEPSLNEMRRVLTLPTRQLNASHDAEVLFYEKHTDLEVFLGLLSIVLCIFIQFLYHYSFILHFWPKNTCIAASAELKSSNVSSTHLFFAPLSPSFLQEKRSYSKRKTKKKKKRKKKEKKKKKRKKEKKKKRKKEKKEKKKKRKKEKKEKKKKRKKQK